MLLSAAVVEVENGRECCVHVAVALVLLALIAWVGWLFDGSPPAATILHREIQVFPAELVITAVVVLLAEDLLVLREARRALLISVLL